MELQQVLLHPRGVPEALLRVPELGRDEQTTRAAPAQPPLPTQESSEGALPAPRPQEIPAQALNSQKGGIFIPQAQWKEFVHDLRKHRRPWGQILHCTRTIPDSKQTLRAELSPGNCSSQSSSGNRDCTDRKEQPGCRKTWDSTFLRKQEFPRAKRDPVKALCCVGGLLAEPLRVRSCSLSI